MARRLPPLNALRAFEAAGRHLSFTRAAEELHVTQAAVSHQVKALEEHLGVRLFRRLTRRLLLTEAGQTLLPVMQEALDRIARTVEELCTGEGAGSLTVKLTPYFASKWLAPRLSRFWQQHPGVDLQLYTSLHPVDFGREEVDAAVRWGAGDWPDVEAELLFCTPLAPVCSPGLANGPRPLRRPADLRRHSLLHDDEYEAWTRWLATAGLRDVEARRGSIMDDTHVLMRAAMDGQGVAVASLPLIAPELAAGQLVQPFELTITGFGYYLVYPPGALTRPRVRLFRDWLQEEAAVERGAG